jgi:hypothetical protein
MSKNSQLDTQNLSVHSKDSSVHAPVCENCKQEKCSYCQEVWRKNTEAMEQLITSKRSLPIVPSINQQLSSPSPDDINLMSIEIDQLLGKSTPSQEKSNGGISFWDSKYYSDIEPIISGYDTNFFKLHYCTPNKGRYDNVRLKWEYELPVLIPINMDPKKISWGDKDRGIWHEGKWCPCIVEDTPSQEIPAPIKKVHIIKDPECGLNKDDSNFRFANQRCLLTYKHHLPKEQFKEWFNKLVNGTTQIEICHEVGKSTGIEYDHSHVLVDFGRNYQTRNCRQFDLTYNNQVIHPNIKIVKTKTHFYNCLNYMAKEDPECAHLKTEINLSLKVWECANLTEVLTKYCKKPCDASGLKSLWNMKPRQKGTLETEPTNIWTKQLTTILESAPHNRRNVYWIYDPIGKTSKSSLVGWLCQEHPEKYSSCCGGNTKDMATKLDNAVNHDNWNGHCFFLDLPREAEEHNFYKAIEVLKNARIDVDKYDSHTLTLSRFPHVVVMANFLPNLYKFSLDRWIILRIQKDKQNWELLTNGTVFEGNDSLPVNLIKLYNKQVEKAKEEKLAKMRHTSPVDLVDPVPKDEKLATNTLLTVLNDL